MFFGPARRLAGGRAVLPERPLRPRRAGAGAGPGAGNPSRRPACRPRPEALPGDAHPGDRPPPRPQPRLGGGAAPPWHADSPRDPRKGFAMTSNPASRPTQELDEILAALLQHVE